MGPPMIGHRDGLGTGKVDHTPGAVFCVFRAQDLHSLLVLASSVTNLPDRASPIESSVANQLLTAMHFPDGTMMVSNASHWD